LLDKEIKRISLNNSIEKKKTIWYNQYCFIRSGVVWIMI
jgi:hypothetical protein